MEYNILITDDEKDIVDIMDRFFTRMGYNTIAINEAPKVLELIKSNKKIDAMILDMKMPIVKGIDIIRELKRIKSEIPVIIVSGSIGIQPKYIKELEGLNYSMDDCLRKPVDLFVLLDKLKEKLG